MKKVTVSIHEDTYRRARLRAAELGTSVSALVNQYLAELASQEADFERRKQMQIELLAKMPNRGFSASDRLSRDEVHERNRRQQ
jgi:hypothetical protein